LITTKTPLVYTHNGDDSLSSFICV